MKTPSLPTTTRFKALELECGLALSYTAFKTAMRLLGQSWANDEDLDRVAAAAELVCGRPVTLDELDLTFASRHRVSWTYITTALQQGRLQIVPLALDEQGAPVVEIPPQGDYFADDEWPEGGSFE